MAVLVTTIHAPGPPVARAVVLVFRGHVLARKEDV
jgi:hypothetical protein